MRDFLAFIVPRCCCSFILTPHSGFPSGHMDFLQLSQMILRLVYLQSSVSVLSKNGVICPLNRKTCRDMAIWSSQNPDYRALVCLATGLVGKIWYNSRFGPKFSQKAPKPSCKVLKMSINAQKWNKCIKLGHLSNFPRYF